LRKEDKLIRSITDLLTNLQSDTSDYDGPIWFRGHSISEWKLLSSLQRIENPPSETNIIKKFKQSATMLLSPRPSNLLEWLFIMRHHNVPTRLLDWSESPLIATYFAVNENLEYDGALWMLLPVELNRSSNIEPDYKSYIPDFDIDQVLKSYTPENFAGETRSKLFPVAFIAPRNNSRMQSQLSVFTINHRDNTAIEEIEDGNHIWRYTISKEYKNKIKKEIKLIGISRFHLFPELESIGHTIKEEECRQ
jgi:hypothetical protein